MELHVCDILKSQLQRSAMVDYVFTAQNRNYFILVLTIPAVEIEIKRGRICAIWSFSTPQTSKIQKAAKVARPQNGFIYF